MSENNEHNQDQLSLKQELLKEEIIANNYDGQKFLEYCINLKENGDDMNNWTYEELKLVVENFKADSNLKQEKLKEQNNLIDEIIATNEENKVIGKAVKHTLNEQNKKIEQIGHTLDKTQNNAEKLNAKIMDLILDSSFCKLYVIIAVLALIMIWLVL